MLAYGLNKPIYAQFVTYLINIFHSNFGTSFIDHRPVLDDIISYFPATMELVFYAVLIGSLFGVLAGFASARWNDRARGDLLRGSAIVSMALPNFWIAIILQLILYTRLGLLPFGGRLGIGMSPPPTITGFYTIDSLFAGQFSVFVSAVEHLILPATTLGIAVYGIMTRVMRTSALEVLNADYVRTAYAKGLTPQRIAGRHIMRNALMPVVTLLGLQIGFLASGTVLVEQIFAWPGVGRYTYQAIAGSDYNAIMGVTLVSAVIYLSLNFLVDLLYLAIDPRIRYW
jgi:peptide/nickel transport system permease protein